MDLEEKIFSELDSNRFGVKIGKSNDDTFSDSNNIQKLKDLGFKLLIGRVDFNDIDLVNKLESIGFRIKDSQMTYYYQLNDFEKSDTSLDSSGYHIREFKESDTTELRTIAVECFDDYGHYFANSRLNKKDCRDVYDDWTYNSCTNPKVADKIFVVEFEGKPVGFLSFKIYEENGKRYAAGGMGAVSTKHRGQSLFPKLVYKGLEWGEEIGLDWEEHNVIINNKPVNRSFTKMGFKPDNFVVTMHCWLDEIK
jgi:hypothetical protein